MTAYLIMMWDPDAGEVTYDFFSEPWPTMPLSKHGLYGVVMEGQGRDYEAGLRHLRRQICQAAERGTDITPWFSDRARKTLDAISDPDRVLRFEARSGELIWHFAQRVVDLCEDERARVRAVFNAIEVIVEPGMTPGEYIEAHEAGIRAWREAKEASGE